MNLDIALALQGTTLACTLARLVGDALMRRRGRRARRGVINRDRPACRDRGTGRNRVYRDRRARCNRVSPGRSGWRSHVCRGREASLNRVGHDGGARGNRVWCDRGARGQGCGELGRLRLAVSRLCRGHWRDNGRRGRHRRS